MLSPLVRVGGQFIPYDRIVSIRPNKTKNRMEIFFEDATTDKVGMLFEEVPMEYSSPMEYTIVRVCEINQQLP